MTTRERLYAELAELPSRAVLEKRREAKVSPAEIVVSDEAPNASDLEEKQDAFDVVEYLETLDDTQWISPSQEVATDSQLPYTPASFSVNAFDND